MVEVILTMVIPLTQRCIAQSKPLSCLWFSNWNHPQINGRTLLDEVHAPLSRHVQPGVVFALWQQQRHSVFTIVSVELVHRGVVNCVYGEHDKAEQRIAIPELHLRVKPSSTQYGIFNSGDLHLYRPLAIVIRLVERLDGDDAVLSSFPMLAEYFVADDIVGTGYTHVLGFFAFGCSPRRKTKTS